MVSTEDKGRENQIIRAIYSLRDFELALSALTFLENKNAEIESNRDQLRRQYCYETSAVVSYMRPFSSAHGEVKPLSLEELGITITTEEFEFHKHLKMLRDKVFAHSDFDQMEFRLDPVQIGETGEYPYFPQFTAPKGPGLLCSEEVCNMMSLIRKLIHAIGKIVFNYVQLSPEPIIISGGEIRRLNSNE